MTVDWANHFDTRKPDGTFPYPYGNEMGEPYIFTVEDFLTREGVIAWFRMTEGSDFDEDEWQIDEEPHEYLIHDHDEDLVCGNDDACPKARRVLGWYAG